MHKILVVDDAIEIFQLVQRALGSSFHLEWAKTQRDAARLLEKKDFDLILLDLMLPDGDGYQLCSLLQTHERWASIPVIILSAKNSVADKVLGFSVGADDYMLKPFESLELKARIEAKLRKREKLLRTSEVIVVNDLEINKSTQRVSIMQEGQSHDLDVTPTEFKILLYMANRPNQAITRDEILDTVWGENVHVYSRSVDTHMSKLRRKLGSKQHYIESVHGTGYRLAVDSTESTKVLDFGGRKDGTQPPQLHYGRLG